MAQVRWTAEAERWLRDIHDYIANDDPAAASKVVVAIYEKAEQLLRFPEMGQRYGDRAESPVRVLLYGHYRIAYLLTDDGDVHILGVFHGPSTLSGICSSYRCARRSRRGGYTRAARARLLARALR
jgi:plasmid stabilization system protein ParE